MNKEKGKSFKELLKACHAHGIVNCPYCTSKFTPIKEKRTSYKERLEDLERKQKERNQNEIIIGIVSILLISAVMWVMFGHP